MEYDLVPGNPAREDGGEGRPPAAHRRSAGQIMALLEAAGELDAEARADRGVARRPARQQQR